MPNVITDQEQTDQADGAEHSGQPEPDPTRLVVRNTFLDLEDCWAKSVQECQEMSRAKRGSPGVATVVTVCQGVLCWLLRVVFLWFCKLAFRIFLGDIDMDCGAICHCHYAIIRSITMNVFVCDS